MIHKEDGSVVAKNAAEVMQCLLAGYVSDKPSAGSLSFRVFDGQLQQMGQRFKWDESGNWMNEGRTFRRPDVKEPEWLSPRNAFDFMIKGYIVGYVANDETFKLLSQTPNALFVLQNCQTLCLKSDYDRWQSELAAQSKPYEPTDEEVGDMANTLHKVFNDGIDVYISGQGHRAQARYVLQRIHEARQFALPAVPQAPQKTYAVGDIVSFKEAMALPCSTKVHSLYNGDSWAFQIGENGINLRGVTLCQDEIDGGWKIISLPTEAKPDAETLQLLDKTCGNGPQKTEGLTLWE